MEDETVFDMFLGRPCSQCLWRHRSKIDQAEAHHNCSIRRPNGFVQTRLS
jgi:hypothetical protein